MRAPNQTAAAIEAAIGDLVHGRMTEDEKISAAALLACMRANLKIGVTVGAVHYTDENTVFENLVAALDEATAPLPSGAFFINMKELHP